tara:strand:- start:2446 stop:2700 length:255 start_codon:yes stop_codon:yes gene_type:complete
MDFMLEEEMIDLVTFCLQNPNSSETMSKKSRIKEIGKEIFNDGGFNGMENIFFAVENRVEAEINISVKPLRSLWNGISDEWNHP